MGTGKTLLCRQLLRYAHTFNPVISYYVHTVQHHILITWRAVEKACITLEVEYSQHKHHFDALNEFRHKETLKDHILEAIFKLAASGLLEECQTKSRHLKLPYNYEYFVNNMKRMLDAKYIPTEQDLLNSVGFTQYHLLELPGHHLFRRRWQDFFKYTAAVFFLVDLSELCDEAFYHGHLKGKTVQIFNNLLPSPVLRDAGLIVLFNKKDKFLELSANMAWSNLAQHIRNNTEALSFYRSQFITLLPKGRSYHHTVSLISAKSSATMSESLNTIMKNNKENMKPL
ncbi:unnamed protein product [Auanema sp. JU1783]|nr:unnamed protein product [Auanema sp. JU1783]